MSKFKKWVRRVLPFPSHNSQSSSSHPSELSKSDDWPVDQCPVLPEERPRPLTASSSNESLVHSAAASTASSLFFRLPYEIRRRILIEAFGERILHINLTFGHPRVVMDKEDIEETYRGESAYLFREVPHCGYKIARPDSPRRVNGYAVDTGQPKRWIWHGSVCHHNCESVVRRGKRGEGGIREPFVDRCFDGRGVECHTWSGEMPSKCYPGVMGWLLTCRQA